MFKIITAYRHYPYRIPTRTKVSNVVRYFFKLPLLEKLLVNNLSKGKTWWRKLIPPLYFYRHNEIRKANRNGINYSLDLSCLIDHSIFFYTLNEPSWTNLLKLVKSDFIVWDVGANIGYLTLNFARVCPQGCVYAFEPDSVSFDRLRQNINQNTFSNISITQQALGARREVVTLYKLYHNNPGANRILLSGKQRGYATEKVEVTTGDILMVQLNSHRLDVLKIDVEGFELFVLKGAQGLVQKFRPILFVELAELNLNEHNLTSVMLIECIEKLDYDVIDARTMIPIDKSKSNHHTDVLCFPKKINLEEN